MASDVIARLRTLSVTSLMMAYDVDEQDKDEEAEQDEEREEEAVDEEDDDEEEGGVERDRRIVG